MTHLSLIFLVAFASLMTAGSISILSFSFNLQSVPPGIIGVSYSLAAFPILSRNFREKNLVAFKRQVTSTLRFIIFWSLPLTALFIILRAQIVRVLLGTGEFSWSDTRLTAAAVALFSISALFQCLLLVFMRGFYSAGLTKKPFLINLISTIILVLSTWGLVELFYLREEFRYFISSLLKVEDLPGTVVLMLPLGFSIATIINGTLHWLAFEREFKGVSSGLMKTLFDSIGASVVIGGVSYFFLNVFATVFDLNTLFGIFFQGFLSGILGITSGVVVLTLLKNKELTDISNALREKFWKTKVIATEAEIV